MNGKNSFEELTVQDNFDGQQFRLTPVNRSYAIVRDFPKPMQYTNSESDFKQYKAKLESESNCLAVVTPDCNLDPIMMCVQPV